MPMTARTVGRYEIFREVGRGGMATVYLARQTDLDRFVALKELGAPFLADAAFGERFVRESRTAGSLSHTNIVTVHDFFEYEGTPYIAMEYLERGSLRPWVGALQLPQIAGVLEGLLAGLSHAESRGIVHRDLKPENVMVTLEGAVKIADFGIAKAFNQAATSARLLTATGTAVGTPTYMAPEQAMAKDVGPWTDLYSTGIIAYELFLGRVPFHDVDTPVAILLHHVNEQPPPPLSVDPTLDPQLGAWIERLIEKDPAARPQSAAEAWDQLEDVILRLLGPRWRRQGRLVGAPGERAAMLDLSTPPEAAVTRPPEAERESIAPTEVESTGGQQFTPVDDFATYRPGLQAAGPARGPSVEEPSTPPPGGEEPDAQPALDLPDEEIASSIDEEPENSGNDEPVFLTYRGAPAPEAESSAPIAVPPEELGVEDVSETAVPAPPALPTEPEQDAEAPVVAAARHELAATVPPVARRALSFEWPAVPRGRLVRLRWISLLVVGALLAVAGVAVAILAGGGSSSGKHRTTTPPPPRPERQPAPDVLARLSGINANVLLAVPKGHIVRLDAASLRPAARFADPSHPRSVAVGGGIAYVADDDGLMLFRASDLEPLASVALPRATYVDADAAAAVAAGAGRICIVGRSRAAPCAVLGFTPAGLGITSSGSVFVAHGPAGTIVQYARHGSKLVRRAVAKVGKQPHGRLLYLEGRLYVPVSRGIAVVETSPLRVVRTIRLPGTPVDVAAVPGTRRLFAALYAQNEIAIVDSATRRPATIKRLGRPPVAVVGSSGAGKSASMLVSVSGGDAILRLDGRSGKVLASVRQIALDAHPALLRLRPPRFAVNGRTVTVTIGFGTGRLDRAGLVVRDAAIADGSATFELWQRGVRAPRPGTARSDGLAVAFKPAPGRLVITATSAPGSFVSLQVVRRPDGRSVALRFAKPPVVVVTHPVTTATVPTTTQNPPPPPPPTTSVGVTVG